MNSDLSKPIKRLVWAFLIVSFLGFLDAAYISAKYSSPSSLNCFIFENCDRVISSPYGKIFGMPMSFLGVAFYLAIFVLSAAYLDSKISQITKLKILKFIIGLAFAGFAFSLYLVYLQAFVLHAFCFYCLISATTSTVIFALSVPTLHFLRKL